jgi:hypothetical protein
MARTGGVLAHPLELLGDLVGAGLRCGRHLRLLPGER